MSRAGGGEPTEAPTPRRLAEARRKGQVAMGRDLVAATSLTAAFAALMSVGPSLLAGLTLYLGAALRTATNGGSAGTALAAAVSESWRALRTPMLAAVATALMVGLAQTRGLLAFEALRPAPGRLFAGQNWQRLFGGQAALEMGKGLVKVALVGVITWVTVRAALPSIVALAGATPSRVLAGVGQLTAGLGLRVILAMTGLAVVDYLWVRARHSRQLRMTREEVKREHKETEGDPQHRAERQRLHRAVIEQRMMADVRKADFVVINPEHIAVALQYDGGTQAAPIIVASGERLVAQEIMRVARAARVPIFRDVSLARALRALREGDEIPEALYQAVAEIVRAVTSTAPPGPAATARAGGAAQGAGASSPASGGNGGITWKRV